MRRCGHRLSKPLVSAAEAVADVPSGSAITVGGFGTCGAPHALCEALGRRGADSVHGLRIFTNSAAMGTYSLANVFSRRGMAAYLATSYVGSNPYARQAYERGELAIEFTPQGSLAERMRSAGAGIPAFYTRTGVGTYIETGRFPMRLNPDGSVAERTQPRVTRVFDGKRYLMEEAIRGDFAFVKAWRADKAGNLQFRGTARNFNVPAATAGKVCVAEVEEIVETGELKPDEIHLPGVYVQRLVKPAPYEHVIEKVTPRDTSATAAAQLPRSALATMATREKIQRRAALELYGHDGLYYNLGIGMPTAIPDYVPPPPTNDEADAPVIWGQGENGMLGVGPYPATAAEADPNWVNASKEAVTYLPGCSTFSSDQSFAMLRGGHVDVTILGAMQVASSGDLANWIVPGHKVMGMGGAMDLVSSGCRVVVTMEHAAKGGKPKILKQCSLPLTGERCVDRIITELAVFDIDKTGDKPMTLVELAPGVTVDALRGVTGAEFVVAEDVLPMRFAGVEA